jgi:PAB-dependent poly(A)-specific ribonuclease subunit 3
MASVAASAPYKPGGGQTEYAAPFSAQTVPSYVPSEESRRQSGSHGHGKQGKSAHGGASSGGNAGTGFVPASDHPNYNRPQSVDSSHEYGASSGQHHQHPQQQQQQQQQQHASGHHHHHHQNKHHHGNMHSAWAPSRTLGPLSAHATTRGPQQFFMAEQLRRELLNRTVLCLKGTDPEDSVSSSLPRLVHRYHSLYPLEDATKDKVSQVYGVPTFVYKATDGVAFFAIRRFDGVRVNELTNPAVEAWKSIIHPHVVSLREVFVSNAFNNTNSLYVSYEYHPSAETLEQRFPACALSQNRPPGYQNDPKGLSEDILWAILIQLVSALRAIHAKGLSAAKQINGSKIIIVGKNRLRLSAGGIDELFKYDSRKQVVLAKQQEDIVALGQLMLRLAAPVTDVSFAATQKALEDVAANCSVEFHSVLLRLLGLIQRSGSGASSSAATPTPSGTAISAPSSTVTGQYPSLDEIQHMLAIRAFAHLEKTYNFADALEGELCKELDNGRLFRLMVKLGFINERPEYDFSTSWSETGDRFPLKLFRDYVFHQVDEEGNPVMDISHVVECLNKIEAGTDERVLLMSRDEKSMLVLAYKDLKRYLVESFNELVQKQTPAFPR